MGEAETPMRRVQMRQHRSNSMMSNPLQSKHLIRDIAGAGSMLLLAVGFGCASARSTVLQSGLDPERTDERFPPEERQRIEVFQRACPSIVHVESLDVRRDPTHFNVLEIPTGMGSGFVWDQKGHIVTNAHVIRDAEEARVLFKDGRAWIATLMGIDTAHDIAVLMIGAPKDSLIPITVEAGNRLRVGQTVLAIGNPFGLDHTLTAGIVSALGRDLVTESGEAIHDVIQIDAAINPGNSGGPLLDSAGRLIGINTALVSPTGVFAGIGFAVPVNVIVDAVANILGRIPAQHPGLGIRTAEDSWVRELGLSGVLVMEVLPGGAAEQSGMRATRTSSSGDLELGDLIVAIDGVSVSSRSDLAKALSERNAGQNLAVTVHRGSESAVLAVILVLEQH
jgi:S1-C subfamily serine protease